MFSLLGQAKVVLGQERFLKSFYWDDRHTQIAVIIAVQLILFQLLEHFSHVLNILNWSLDFPKFLFGFFDILSQNSKIVYVMGQVLTIIVWLYFMYLTVVIVIEGHYTKSNFKAFIENNKIRLLIVTIICFYGYEAVLWLFDLAFNMPNGSIFRDVRGQVTYTGYLTHQFTRLPFVFGSLCIVTIVYALSYRVLVKPEETSLEDHKS